MRNRELPRETLFGECITRTWTIKAVQAGALNLSQGFPEEEPADLLKKAACDAIQVGSNQYADMRGSHELRSAIARRWRTCYDVDWVDADAHVTVTCGATEAMAASVLATVGPGHEVVVQAPTYENYPPQVLLAGGKVRFLTLAHPEWRITRARLEAAFDSRPRVLILNTPNNPTGRVFSEEELFLVRDYCVQHDTIALVDEVYEHLVWDGRRHIRMAAIDGMRDRTVTISSISKSYSATGWRVGWVVAPSRLTGAIRRVHDFLTATVPTPLQAAATVALAMPSEYYSSMRMSYERRRALLVEYMKAAGLQCAEPEGAYYLFPTCEGLPFRDSEEFAVRLLEQAKVAIVPYTAFYPGSGSDKHYFRINFAKSEETLREAGERMVSFCSQFR